MNGHTCECCRGCALDAFRVLVDAAMVERFGITWQDACGDDGRLLRYLETLDEWPRIGAGTDDALELVLQFGERYDLVPATGVRHGY